MECQSSAAEARLFKLNSDPIRYWSSDALWRLRTIGVCLISVIRDNSVRQQGPQGSQGHRPPWSCLIRGSSKQLYLNFTDKPVKDGFFNLEPSSSARFVSVSNSQRFVRRSLYFLIRAVFHLTFSFSGVSDNFTIFTGYKLWRGLHFKGVV